MSVQSLWGVAGLNIFQYYHLVARAPYFFKVKSRIGLTHPPIRHSEFNFGVEEAADAVLTEEFLSGVANPHTDSFVFSDPEKIPHEKYWQIITGQLKALKDLINSRIKADETQVVLGGDNTVTLSSLEAVIERVGNPSKIGYIQFDSHGEMHQSETSISKNFHGMYMRPFFDKFDQPDIDSLVPAKMQTNQILAVGDIVFDGENTEEERFYKENNIRNISREEFNKDKQGRLEEIDAFLNRFEHIHVNFDVDVFDRSVSEATGLPEDGRWFKDEVFTILDLIFKRPGVSLDMVEINPKKPGAEKTVKLAREIILKLLNQ